MGSPQALSSMDNSYSWPKNASIHTDLAALLLHLEKIMFESGNFGPWAPVFGPPWGPDAPVKQITCPFSHEWLFFWILHFEIYEYVFSRRGNTHFTFGTPHQSLHPPPPSSRAKGGSPRNWYEHSLLFTCEMYQTQCDLSAELFLDVEYKFLWKKSSYGP